MKKIMFVIGTLSNGGAERVISVLSQYLSENKYKVCIVTVYDKKYVYR